jgi:hypothetical protein
MTCFYSRHINILCLLAKERVASKNTILCYLKQDADAKVHERLREVYHTLPGIVDCHGTHC